MANGVSGYFDLTGSNGITMRIHYGETYDVTTNQSVVSITALQVMSSWYYGVTYYLDGTITVDGSTAASMSSSGGTNGVALVALNTWANVGGTLGSVSNIAHNTDGSKSVTIAVSVKGYTTSGSAGSGWTVSGSKTIALTTIPRASTIGATDANIGAVSMIAVSKKSSGYTHSIHYQFGSLSGYITAAGGVSASEVKISDTSIAFTVPTSFYTQIPNAKSGVCTLTCKTYSGSTQIGDAQTAAFTAVASEAACAPNVSGTVVDVNERTKALTGDESVLVRYYSTALAAITASAKNSAAIAAKYIGGVDVTADSREIPDVESGNVIFSAMDSRGYSASITVVRTLIPYIKLTNNAVVQRTDPTSGNAVLTLSGDYYNGSFGAADNALTASYVVDGGDLVAVVPTVEGSKYTASVDLSGLDYNAEHSVEVTVSDKLATVTKRLTVRRGIPIFDWGENDFAFHVPLTVCGNPIVPPQIGYIYLSRDSTSPAELFGGTWERIEGVFLLAAGSDYAAGSTGGEAAHTLTVPELPSHSFPIASGAGVIASGGSNLQRGWGTDAKYVYTSAVGEDVAHNNMPPYLAVYMWTRVA